MNSSRKNLCVGGPLLDTGYVCFRAQTYAPADII